MFALFPGGVVLLGRPLVCALEVRDRFNQVREHEDLVGARQGAGRFSLVGFLRAGRPLSLFVGWLGCGTIMVVRFQPFLSSDTIGLVSAMSLGGVAGGLRRFMRVGVRYELLRGSGVGVLRSV